MLGLLYLWLQSDVMLTQIPDLLNDWLRQWGFFNAALIYIILYTVRPLTLFPASLLTIASGLVFGPWYGVLFTIIGENCSANLAFVVARWFGRDWVQARENNDIIKWEAKLSDNGLMTVLIMRLIYLPFDAVNFGCGLTSMRQRDFALGTFIGIMPGLVSFVLLGGSVASGVDNRITIIGISVACFLLGIIVAKRIRKHNLGTPQS
ncbi:hypothetical protein A9Q99_08060 [Gammaproteobacteria bacterium 45_16_T64]|nr:hypothetical protein A9Q99_08060 [Gammaproteobacteria bacterium 45_16_T64]